MKGRWCEYFFRCAKRTWQSLRGHLTTYFIGAGVIITAIAIVILYRHFQRNEDAISLAYTTLAMMPAAILWWIVTIPLHCAKVWNEMMIEQGRDIADKLHEKESKELQDQLAAAHAATERERTRNPEQEMQRTEIQTRSAGFEVLLQRLTGNDKAAVNDTHDLDGDTYKYIKDHIKWFTGYDIRAHEIEMTRQVPGNYSQAHIDGCRARCENRLASLKDLLKRLGG